MISSPAVTVTIARANTRPVARAYFRQPMDLRKVPPRYVVTDSPSEAAKGRSASVTGASLGDPNAARASARCSARSSPGVLGTPTGGIRLRIPSPVRRKACEKTAAPVVALALTTAAPMIVPVTPSTDASTAPTTVASALATTCTAVRSSTLRFGAGASASLRFSIDVP
ncbi:hypothetical protein ABZY05_37675 [Streptomyces canus]|uniref:hypothetical protein n=1 Tax=Streptomyces canus TaxID=58343 RepID=UPI0033AF0DB7